MEENNNSNNIVNYADGVAKRIKAFANQVKGLDRKLIIKILRKNKIIEAKIQALKKGIKKSMKSLNWVQFHYQSSCQAFIELPSTSQGWLKHK